MILYEFVMSGSSKLDIYSDRFLVQFTNVVGPYKQRHFPLKTFNCQLHINSVPIKIFDHAIFNTWSQNSHKIFFFFSVVDIILSTRYDFPNPDITRLILNIFFIIHS